MSLYVKSENNCQTICNLRFPSYSSVQKQSWSGINSYTFKEDCYVCICSARSNAYGYGCEIKLNSVMLIHMTSNKTENWQSMFLPVSAGDVLSCNSYFLGDIQIIPMK